MDLPPSSLSSLSSTSPPPPSLFEDHNFLMPPQPQQSLQPPPPPPPPSSSKRSQQTFQFKCQVPGCRFLSNNKYNYTRHLANIHSGDRPSYRCNFSAAPDGSDSCCQFETRWPQDLERHKLAKHTADGCHGFQDDNNGDNIGGDGDEGVTTTGLQPQPLPIPQYRCNFPNCQYVSKFERNLKRHQVSHNPKDRYRCDQCAEFATNNPYNLKMHKLTVHQTTMTSTTSTTRTTTKTSTTNDNGDDGHGEPTTTKKKNPQRQQIAKYRCDYPACQFAAKTRKNLNDHRLKHSSERPFKCQFPGCQFSSKWQRVLKNHQILHDPKAPIYGCDFPGCEYRTKWPGDFRRHQKSHDTATPFRCEQCSFRCKRGVGLANHLRRIHSILMPKMSRTTISNTTITTPTTTTPSSRLTKEGSRTTVDHQQQNQAHNDHEIEEMVIKLEPFDHDHDNHPMDNRLMASAAADDQDDNHHDQNLIIEVTPEEPPPPQLPSPSSLSSFQCSNCQYSTDRHYNLKRHILTMHK